MASNDKPGILRNLRVKRVSLVDMGANFDTDTGDGAHIMLFKRRDVVKDGPGIGSVHVDSPDWDADDQDDYEKADLTGEGRRALPDSAFAAVWTDAQGKKHRKLPIHDAGHLAAARGRVAGANIPASVKADAQRKIDAANKPVSKESTLMKLKDILKRMTAAVKETDIAKRDADLIEIEKDAEKVEFEMAAPPPPPPTPPAPGATPPPPAAAKPAAPGGAPDLAAMKAHHDVLTKMIGAYGPGPHPPEHPVHGMVAAHQQLKKTLTAGGVNCDDMGAGAMGTGVAKIQTEEVKVDEVVEKRMVDLEKRNTELLTQIEVEKNLRLDREMVDILKSFKATPFNFDTDVAKFRKMKDASPEAFERTMEVLKAQDAQIAAGQLFQNIGKSGAGSGGVGSDAAWQQIEAKADAMLEKGATNLTREQAIEKVMLDSRNKELIKQYRNAAQ